MMNRYKKFLFKYIIDEEEFNKCYFPKRKFESDTIKYEGELYRKSNRRAGYDLVQHEDITIPPNRISKIKTNVRFPDGIGDNFALVTLRSSYQNSRLMMPAIGILDSNYSDYLFITVYNSSDESIKISKGDRFGQLVFIKNNGVELIGSD